MKAKKQTKAQKRVALARDVLAQLKAKKIAVGYCGYVFVDDVTGACEVCAAGALAVACCGAEKVDCVESFGIKDCLSPTFSLRQLGLIEAAFEQHPEALSLNYDDGNGTPEEHRAANKYPAESTREERLPLIMRNIIRNNGEFRP